MITVIVCTYNRCQPLAEALASVAASRMPEAVDWEVLVVDNNSSDRTHAVVEGFAERYPGRFRYLFEGNAGKSYALNAGVAAARGEVLAFMDDDVRVDAGWLDALTSGLRVASEWSGAGGPVILKWLGPPPPWLDMESPHANAPLAGFNLQEHTTAMNEPPFGTNMAFRKSMFVKYGLFRTDLGPGPRSDTPRPNEDTEFGRRLLNGGERLRYAAAAIVNHPVPPERLQKEYFLRWWYDKGRADVREFGTPAGAIAVGGVPLFLYRRLAVWTLRWMLSPGASRRFEGKLKVWGKRGEISECRYQNASRKDSHQQPSEEKKKAQCASVI